MIKKMIKYLQWQNIIFVSFFIIILLISTHQLYFNTTRYLYILVFTLVIWLLLKKCFNSINNINKFILLLFTYLCFLQGYSIVEMFYPYPTIINSESYDKAIKISESIINYPINREFHVDKDTTSIVLHTDNVKIFDRIAIDIADSDFFDDSIKIGIMHKPSDDMYESNNSLEKELDKRIRCIQGVNFVKTSVVYNEENGKINPDLTTISVNIKVKEGANKEKIYKIVNNFLPMPNENKKIIIQNE